MWEGIDEPLPRGQLADRVGLAAALLSAQPGAARDDARRHGRDRSPTSCRRSSAADARRLRHDRAARRARLSAGELHLAADQPAHRRIRRRAGQPPALSARGVPRHAQGLAGRQADVGAHLGDRLGRTAASPATTRSQVARAFARGRLRPDRRLDRPDHAGRRSRSTAACTRRRSPTRSATRPGIATMCVGAITSADQVNTIVAAGRADLVALARPHLVDPSFTMKAAAWYGADGHRLPAAISLPAATSCSATASASART